MVRPHDYLWSDHNESAAFTSEDEPEQQEHDDRADQREHPAREVSERRVDIESEQPGDPAADHGAEHAQQDRDEPAAGVFARQDDAGDDACQDAENGEGEKSDGEVLSSPDTAVQSG